MAKKTDFPEAQNPLILRAHRLMEAFAKSDDEKDFYLDRSEGFIIYADLDKTEEELQILATELASQPNRFVMIPKLTFYETKKIMEGFVHEKVYDIDTKEKLLDIIQSKEARENFLEFIYDQHSELEKWQQFYQERSRIRIIEWLRNHHFHFVFEEDLDLSKQTIEKLKEHLFDKDVSKELSSARKILTAKAKTYYSNEALHPRPKRGRPPKQIQKLEFEPQVSRDIYTTVPKTMRPFLFTPDISSALDVTFSAKFETGEELMATRRSFLDEDIDEGMEDLNQKLASLRTLSSRWKEKEEEEEEELSFDEEDDEEEEIMKKPSSPQKKIPIKKTPKERSKLPSAPEKPEKAKPKAKAAPKSKPQKLRRTTQKKTTAPKVVEPKSREKKPKTKAIEKTASKPKRKLLRRTPKKK